MQLQKFTLTQAQQLLVSALLSMAGSAVVGSFNAAYQYYGQHQNIDVGSLLVYALTTFFVLFSTALYAYIPGHIQQLLQAYQDTIAQNSQTIAGHEHTIQTQQEIIASLNFKNAQLSKTVQDQQQIAAQPIASTSVQDAPQPQLGPLVVIHTTPATQSGVTVTTPPLVATSAQPLASAQPPVQASVPLEHPPFEEMPTLADQGAVQSQAVQPDQQQSGAQGQVPQQVQPLMAVSSLSVDTMPRAAVGRTVQ